MALQQRQVGHDTGHAGIGDRQIERLRREQDFGRIGGDRFRADAGHAAVIPAFLPTIQCNEGTAALQKCERKVHNLPVAC